MSLPVGLGSFPQGAGVEFEPTNSGALLFSYYEGVFRTRDNGTTWEYAGFPSSTIVALAQHQTQPNLLYAASEQSGVFRSRDGGQSWELAGSSPVLGVIRALVADPVRVGVLYVGSDLGVWKSLDAGASWSRVVEGLTTHDIFSLAIDPKNPEVLYAGGRSYGVFKSENGGISWRQLNVPAGAIAITVSPSNPERILLGFPGGAYASKDGGGTWSPFLSQYPGVIPTDFLFHPQDPDLVLVYTERGLLRSPDFGKTWRAVGPQVAYGYLAASGEWPEVMYSCVNGGFFRSVDRGLSWFSENVGVYWEGCRDLLPDASNSLRVFAGSRSRGVLEISFSSPDLVITTSELPPAETGRPYDVTLRAQGGKPPYVWGLYDGTMPPGLYLDRSGRITGVLSGAPGNDTIIVQVRDANGALALRRFSQWTTGIDVYPLRLFVPVVAHLTGHGGSQWRSDVALLNFGGADVPFRLIFHGTTPPTVVSGLLPAMNQKLFADVLSQLGVDGVGVLEIQSQQNLLISSRTYSLEIGGCLGAEATFGQDVDVFTKEMALSTFESAMIPNLPENLRYRSNIIIANIGDEEAEVVVQLFTGTGDGLVSELPPIMLAPHSLNQINRPFLGKLGLEQSSPGFARISVVRGSGVIAFGSVVDNTTNDPTTVPMRKW